MATAIRLKRGGRTHAPYYRIVVMDSRVRSCGRVLEEIGVYHPCARPEPIIELDEARALAWLGQGARPTDTVRSVFSKQGIMATFAAGTATQEPESENPPPAVEPLPNADSVGAN